jgi:hypothetical protein
VAGARARAIGGNFLSSRASNDFPPDTLSGFESRADVEERMRCLVGRSAWSSLVGIPILVMAVAAAPAIAEPRDEFWSIEEIRTFHVTVGESDWQRMVPSPRPSRWAAFFAGNRRAPGTRPATQPAQQQQPDDDDDEPPQRLQPAERLPYGTQLPYVFAEADFEGAKYADIGLRFKGNSSYALARNSIKKPFKLDFNRYLEDGTFREAGGVTILNFNNNAMDPSQLRESLAYKLFRDAGVPAPRTTFARVYFTVPGVHDRTYVGLYTVIEEVNDEFLKHHFDSKKGLLLKPEGVSGFKYHGDEWRHYHGRYDPRNANAKNARRFAEFVKLVDKADDDEFRRRIGDLLALDAFARFLAVNVVLSNTDSILGTSHNYYIYLDPKSDKVHFIPWDLNLSMGSFMMAGSVEQQADLSIDEPHAEHSNLVRRLLALDDFRARYRGHVKRIVEHHFTVERMTAEVARLEALVSGAVEEEKKLATANEDDRAMGPWRPPEVPKFVEARLKSIEDQLAGKSRGTPPMPHRRPTTAPATAPAAQRE